MGKRLGKDEVVEPFVVGSEHVVLVAAPFEVALVDKGDGLPDGDDGVDVVGVDHGGDVEFMGDFVNQLVDEEGGFGVEAGVGFVAEEVLGVAGDGAGDGGTFLHTTAQLGGIKLVGAFEVHPLEAEIHPIDFLAPALGGQHREWEHHVLLDGHGVEQSRPLEHHAHFGTDGLLLLVGELVEIPSVIEDFTLFRSEQPDEVLHHHGLAGAGPPDDEVHLAVLEAGVDALQYLPLPEVFRYIDQFYHGNLLVPLLVSLLVPCIACYIARHIACDCPLC